MKYKIIFLVLIYFHVKGYCQWHNDFHSTHEYQTKALRKLPKQKWVFEAEGAVYCPALKEGKSLFFGDEAGYL